MSVFLIALFCMIVNIPMGIWRSKHAPFSWQWFAAIHAPVPLVVLVRIASGISLYFVPIFILASVLGQYVGPVFCHGKPD